MMAERNSNIPYQLFTLALCILVIGLLLFDSTVDTNEQTQTLLKWIDYGLCLLFFIDFIYQLIISENRKRYMLTWGWIDLISCLPIFGWGRVARILRILKLLKAIRSSKVLFDVICRKKGESALLTAALFLICGTLFGSVAIMQSELERTDATIQNASDAIWWTFCTIMKGGCENLDPVSIEGRFIAVVLMFLGMAINGTVIGCAAMLLTSNNNGNNPSDDLSNA